MKPLGLLLASALSATGSITAPAANQSPTLTNFDEGFLYGYLSFEKALGHADGVATIKAKNGKGGAGINLSTDWSAFAEQCPAIEIRLGAGNKTTQLKLLLTNEAKGKTSFTYDLSKANKTGFTRLLPADGKMLGDGDFDLSKVKELHIQGTWRPEPVDIAIDKVIFAQATEETLAARAKAVEKARLAEERKQREEERKRQAREATLAKGAEHPEDGPQLVHVGLVGEKLLGIEIQAGKVLRSAPEPYTKQEGDVIKPSNKTKLAWKDGRAALVPAEFELYRPIGYNSRPKKVGILNSKAGTVWAESMRGANLDIDVVDDPRAYRVKVGKSDPIQPVAVFRKSKPNSIAQVSGEFSGQHFVYLELPNPVGPGAEIEVEFYGLNTRDRAARFVFDSTKIRSEAIHVSHLGFRADDPFKRGYVSLWTGTGGGRTPAVTTFELLDTSGKAAFRGQAKLGMEAGQKELFSNERNHTGADVYHLDFSEFSDTGSYRIHVPGLGVSYPFPISKDAWMDAFAVSMHGFLTHRSGIALGPPLTDYNRPRTMHPLDGFVVFKTDVTIWDGEADAIAGSLKRLMGKGLDTSKLEIQPDAWGGYMDAGDWDRRSQHLICSLRHLELLDMFPKQAAAIRLSLPRAETENDIADILDEALWNIEFYQRIQEPDGGVRGGIESTAHPRPGEASWQESLLAGSFRPDPETSYRYAGVAAKAARLLGEEAKAEDLGSSAVRAWEWAEANVEKEIATAVARGAKGPKNAEKNVAGMKALAAAELYRFTGDAKYHQAVTDSDPTALNDTDVAMSYALIPEAQADAGLRARALNTIVNAADAALEVSENNGFNLAPPTRYLPMMGYTCIWSTPGSTAPPTLPRAHFQTRDAKYLAGAIAACQYPGGANPMNMSYTTGIGARQPLAPLHIDSRVSGQAPPAGITVYGQSDPSMGYGFDSFAHTWFLNRFGGVDSKEWPTAEAYIDLGNWPAMNEYTVHQTLSPTSYHWGYLALRPQLTKP